jgi:acyl-CoA synthetase (AMP-forming)/AMP-acid ligase II
MPETAADTVRGLIDQGPGASPALGAPDRRFTDFAALRRLMDDTATFLAGFGIGRTEPVALVCARGATSAAAFLAVAGAATAAPIDPLSRAEELEFLLSELGAAALVMEAGLDSPVPLVAARLGLPVLTLTPTGAGAGLFDLAAPPRWAGTGRTPGRPPRSDDIALLLPTSGTVSRPKLVALTHGNLCASAAAIAASLALTAADRCFNPMPLFQIHGLMAGTLAPLSAGGSVWYPTDSDGRRMLGWLAEARPTWYTAAPILHQAMLAGAEADPDAARAAGLRLIRTSSAPLHPRIAAGLRRYFAAPLIEAYGVTEAAHQVACTGLSAGDSPGAGSVGRAHGSEVAVLTAEGRIRRVDAAGEIVVRGPNVTPGYAGNPNATTAAFIDGWFRTGDLGRLDADGFLWITGRLKEMINRGGEKVSPPEVDAVLQDHPAVAQAVTFALPDEDLGEDVAAAVVLNPGTTVTEAELRDFVGTRLAAVKVPRRIVVVDEIPKSATGKLQRIGLAARLGLKATGR